MTAPVDGHVGARPPELEPEPAGPRDHLAELRTMVARLGGRGREGALERRLLVVGALLVPLGVVCIVAGYWGAAHAPRVIQQVPYEISGGMLGLALVFGGGFAYFAAWLTQLLRAQQRLEARLDGQTGVLVEELRLIRAALESAGAGAVAPALVRTTTGTLVHLPTCTLVVGRETRPALDEDGRPCKVCRPVALASAG
jgi:hypothetical protein